MATKNTLNNATGELTVDPGASGDSFVQFDINATGEFRIGVDDGSGDAFKISQGSALGTNDTFIMTAAGESTMPLQPAFGAIAVNQINVTGDATVYTVTFSSSEFFDQNNDFDGTSTFTAPVTGKYQLSTDILFNDILSTHTESTLTISTSNRDYTSEFINPFAAETPGENISLTMSVLADMDSADTVVIKTTFSNGTKVVDILGANAFFNGYLAC